MRHALLMVSLWLPLTVLGQGFEAGVRYWLSTGESVRSHNAQEAFPAFGNPTSVLTYEALEAHTFELHARKGFGERWFVRGNAGLGWVRGGGFDDEDFFAGQVKFSDSTSVVRGNRIAYGGIDVGRDLWTLGGGATTIGLFVGLHQWSERLDAYGAVFTIGGSTIEQSVPVISNEVTWRSLRLGVTASARFNPRTRLTVDLAWVPRADVRDEDSHYLRTSPTDLGPTPNIILEGKGHGMQLDLEVRHRIGEHWDLGVGMRHWWLRATRGERFAGGIGLPLTELESQRSGATFSITRRW